MKSQKSSTPKVRMHHRQLTLSKVKIVYCLETEDQAETFWVGSKSYLQNLKEVTVTAQTRFLSSENVGIRWYLIFSWISL